MPRRIKNFKDILITLDVIRLNNFDISNRFAEYVEPSPINAISRLDTDANIKDLIKNSPIKKIKENLINQVSTKL